MKGILKAAAVVAAFAVAAPANASPLPPVGGSYEGTYGAEKANSHAFWMPGLFSSVSSNWTFTGDSGVFNYHGGSMKLSGTIGNTDVAGGSFNVDVNFDYSGDKGGRTPKCEFGGYCSNATYVANSDQFEYFDYTDNVVLNGMGALAGLVLKLTLYPDSGLYPPQLGYGADNKNKTAFGMSTWFTWDVLQNTNNVVLNKQTGKGDINIKLTPVPIPAALPLLAGGLGLIGFVGWRRRRANA